MLLKLVDRVQVRDEVGNGERLGLDPFSCDSSFEEPNKSCQLRFADSLLSTNSSVDHFIQLLPCCGPSVRLALATAALDEICNSHNYFFDIVVRRRAEVSDFRGDFLCNLICRGRNCIHEFLRPSTGLGWLDNFLLVLVAASILLK